VAVISDTDLSDYGTDDYLESSHLITFGEAKHMSAFAELIASFIGLVHELLPDKLDRLRLYDGTPIDPNATYTIATNNFMAAGVDPQVDGRLTIL
jgi:hypothetical protein